MNYLSVEQVAKSYGERLLFRDLSFGINQGQKVGFVAKNGTGKTSLLNMLSGKDTPDEGRIVFRKGLNVAFIDQNPDLDPQLTVEETIFSKEKPILKIIEAYEKALLHPEDTEAYQKAFDAMDAHNAFAFRYERQKALLQFGFSRLCLGLFITA